jgi:hypothetical protein
MANEKQNSDARMLDSQTRAKETQAQIELEQQRLQLESGGGEDGGLDKAKMIDFQLRADDIRQRQEDAMLDAINRKRDRESRERLAAIKLAEEVSRNPQALGYVDKVIDPAMLQRLESNEPTLDGKKTGEL